MSCCDAALHGPILLSTRALCLAYVCVVRLATLCRSIIGTIDAAHNIAQSVSDVRPVRLTNRPHTGASSVLGATLLYHIAPLIRLKHVPICAAHVRLSSARMHCYCAEHAWWLCRHAASQRDAKRLIDIEQHADDRH